jgi:hypothetical protein
LNIYNRRLRQLSGESFGGPRESRRAQLRSAVLLNQIRQPDEPVPDFQFDPIALARANDLARLSELTRSARERRVDPGQLPLIAQTYEDLAAIAGTSAARRAELLAVAASTWSLAGYQANSASLAAAFQLTLDVGAGLAPASVERLDAAAPAGIALIAAAVLLRDSQELARLGRVAGTALPDLAQRFLDDAQGEPLDQADTAVLAAYGLLGRAGAALAYFWRTGDRSAGVSAATDSRRAARLVLEANVVDTWALVDNTARVIEDVVAVSPWRLLRRATTWSPLWQRYVRHLAIGEQPVVQVWPSQRQALDCGLLDGNHRGLVVTMPTSAGKTNIAEWAIIHALAAPSDELSLYSKLAVYVVPTRALAGEVERKLSESLGAIGLRVSSLFGGSEHVSYEMQLIDTTDVLVVTSEKLDLLLRNDDNLIHRLALLVLDEGHLIGENQRGLRLELVVTRIRRLAPQARTLLLSAVLPNGGELAEWLDPGADGANLVDVDWSPSQLRIGIFTWQGPKVDGQRGVVRYRAADADHEFFLPYVLTRHIKRTKLFPTDAKDVAAELALHYEQLGPVLIAAPTRPQAQTAARSVVAALKRHDMVLDVPPDRSPDVVQVERERVVQTVTEFAGSDHELVDMARLGIAYHHSGVPEPVRLAIEAAYRSGALRVLGATSTLGQGVNLPTKTVIVSGTWRGQAERLPVRDFWNVAGRAGRPFRETEGHVILVAKTTSEARRLTSIYLDRSKIEHVESVLAALYKDLARARLGENHRLAPNDLAASLVLEDPTERQHVELAAALDLQLLAMLAEEVIETADEHVLISALEELFGDTLGGVQLGAYEMVSMRPLARFAGRRISALVQRVPDRSIRAAFVRTGLSIDGCESALRAADVVTAALATDGALADPERWPDLRRLLLDQAARVTEVIRSCADLKANPSVVAPIAEAWTDGTTVNDLRAGWGARLVIRDPMPFAVALDRIVVHDLAWALSAVLHLIELRSAKPLPSVAKALPAMVKFGVSTEPACFAASIGVRERAAAESLGQLFPTENGSTLSRFLLWVSTLDPDAVSAVVDEGTARRFLARGAALVTPQTALDLLGEGHGELAAPLRGVHYAGSAEAVASLDVGAELVLERDESNPADPNAVLVRDGNHRRLGFIAREFARVIAPLMDQPDPPSVRATLSQRPERQAATSRMLAAVESFDAVLVDVVITG